jgi:hypothetical protein
VNENQRVNGTSRPPGDLLASGVLFLLAPFVGEVLGTRCG